MLFSDTVKFMVLVLKTNEEKNSGKRYVGQIDLESTLFNESQMAINEDDMTPSGGQELPSADTILDDIKSSAAAKTKPSDQAQQTKSG